MIEAPARSNIFCQPFGRAQVHVERFQIAVVDADELRANREGTIQFRLVMDFDERCQSCFGRESVELLQLGIG